MLVLLCANVLQDSMPIVQDINPDLLIELLHNSKSQEDDRFPCVHQNRFSCFNLKRKKKKREKR